jgi:3-dehydroquinate synthase
MTDATTISVGGPSPYDVLVGPGVVNRAASFLSHVTRALVVCDPTVKDIARQVGTVLDHGGIDSDVVELPPGEQAKTADVLRGLWDEMGRRRLTRSDAVVSVGGGATTDVGGFAAATWMRGVRVVHVPTTLLAMVDAAIGGKTGINTDAGKNLVGAFHPPAGVVVDLDVLHGLPDHEWVNGMAEVVKAGFIGDPVILELVEAHAMQSATATGPHTRELVERAIRVKADVVSADLRESGLREILNYGHTLGHAIETLEDYRIPHGHAVSIGMVFAAKLSGIAGGLDEETVARHRRVLDALGLPTTYGRHTFDELLEVMRVDKKARGSVLRFVVLDALAQPSTLDGPSDDTLRAAFEAVAA